MPGTVARRARLRKALLRSAATHDRAADTERRAAALFESQGRYARADLHRKNAVRQAEAADEDRERADALG